MVKSIENIHWYIKLIILSGITLIIQFISKYNILPVTNVFIPDSKTYELRVESGVEFENFSANAYNIFNSIFYQIGSFTFLPFNLLLLLVSIKLCDTAVGHISGSAAKFAKLFIVYNPYLLIGMVGPNKETILLFICLAFLSSCFSLRGLKLYFIVFILILLPIFVRPVVSVVLLCSILSIPLVNKYRAKNLFLIGLIVYFILNTIPVVRNFLLEVQGNSSDLGGFQGSRILDIALILRAFSDDAILQIPAFFARVALLLFTPVFRPIAMFSLPLPFLDIGYNIVAYLFLPFNIGLIYSCFRQQNKIFQKNVEFLTMFALIGIFTTANNANITFRYLFPYGAIIFALFSVIASRTQKIITFISLIVISITFLISFYLRSPFEADDYSSIIPVFLDWF